DFFLIKKKKLTKAQMGAELNATGFMNALFYPFPIIIGILPPELQAEGLLAASLFLLIQTFYRNTFGVVLGIIYGSNSGKSIFNIFKGLLLFPPTLGMVFGLILRFVIGYVDTTEVLALDIFRDVTMVIMLAIVGLSFKFPKKEEWKEIAIFRGVFTRFGGGLLSSLIIFFLPISIIAQIPLIIQSLAPPAVANSAYAKYFKLDEVLTSRYIALLTLVALVFLPLEIAILLLWMSLSSPIALLLGIIFI
ncbi:MAG: AEC family transporter, partial [Candidatus Heimdallarchaeaceae archaeon]